MDIMDIQAVESKLNDVTVTPIPRSQVQNFYNYQQQREQREQQPQIQISAIHHPPRNSGCTLTNNKHDRDYHHHHQSASSSAAVAAAALQYSQQLQAQLALLQQANTTALPTTLRSAASSGSSSSSGVASNNRSGIADLSISNSASVAAAVAAMQSQLKYPQSISPVMLNTSAVASLPTPLTPTGSMNLTTSSTNNNGVNAAAAALAASSTSNGLSKYAQLLSVIEEMGRDIRPTYTGSRSSTERLKRGLVHARILVRECLMETERSARQ